MRFIFYILLLLSCYNQVLAQIFYGTTPSGGVGSYTGTIFSYNNSTGQVTVHQSLTGINGYNPQNATLTFYNGKFYGVTHSGGLYDKGVLFEWDPQTNIYTKKFDFNDSSGYHVYCRLALYNGKLYGTTGLGGSGGVLFEWDPQTNVYTKKYEGVSSRIGLTFYNGKFYGISGSLGNADLFEWDPITNTYLQKMSIINNGGAYVYGDLTLYNNKFYGMTYNKGTYDKGTIFEWDPLTNIYTMKFSFTGNKGREPEGGLTLYNGKFYGMTGGYANKGVIFEWNPVTNVYIEKFDFAVPQFINGDEPVGDLMLYNNKFYGMTWSSGPDGSGGVIFEWDPSNNNYIVKYNLGGSNNPCCPRNGKLTIIPNCSTSNFTPSNTNLSSGQIGNTYNQIISQTGLQGIITWSVYTGTLPTGLSLNSSTGVISGTPTVGGLFNFTILVTNEHGCTNTKSYSINVNCVPLSFVNTTATNGIVGVSYNLNGAITGNNPSVFYSVSPSLPAGLTLNTSTGIISGIPTNASNIQTYTVTATQGSCSKSQTYTFAINCPNMSFNNFIPNDGTVGVVYNIYVGVTGNSQPVTYSINPALPAGLNLNSATGAISGVPINPNPSTIYTISATQGNCSKSQTYTFAINCPNITFRNTTTTNGIVGTSFVLDTSVTGNSQPVTYSINPALPTELNLNLSTGIISGTPTNIISSTTYVVTATQGSCSKSQTYTFAINCPNISFRNTATTNGIVGTIFSLDASVIGNTQPVFYSVSPSLPVGISLNNIGIISGVSNIEVPLTTYTVTATQGSCSKLQTYTFAINCPNISINPINLTSALLSLPYTQTLEEVGLLGTPIWSVDSGSLPIGLNIDTSTGVISGTPIVEGIYDFTILVTDGICSKRHPYTLEIVRGLISFDVSPNPTERLLVIKSTQKSNYQYQISDLSGRKMLYGSFSDSNEMSIDISPLERGIYIVEVMTPIGNNTFKIVKF